MNAHDALLPFQIEHPAIPPSLNRLGSGNRFKFWRVKKEWGLIFQTALTEQNVPRGLGRVVAEAELIVPTRHRRDEGNFRFFLEKALGDALVVGGWLEDDDSTRFSFGAVRFTYEKGRSVTRIVLFPGLVAA
jgi:hypothetical protein